MTGRHQGLNCKRTFVCQYVAPPRWVLLQHYNMLRLWFIIECAIAHFLCAMHVIDVRASSSSPRLPLSQILFLSRPPLLYQTMEKYHVLNKSLNPVHTQSLTHSPSLSDATGTKVLTLWKKSCRAIIFISCLVQVSTLSLTSKLSSHSNSVHL